MADSKDRTAADDYRWRVGDDQRDVCWAEHEPMHRWRDFEDTLDDIAGDEYRPHDEDLLEDRAIDQWIHELAGRRWRS